MKKLRGIVTIIILSLVILLSVSCEHNVYFPASDTWGVQGYVFARFSEAIDYLMKNPGTGFGISRDMVESDIAWERTIYLLRDVGEGERGEAIAVPSEFVGQLCVNFNGHEYWFDPSLDQFLDIQGGEKIDIINGKTVITEDTVSRTAALAVDVRVVTVDEHMRDDRRKDPKAVSVGENGILVVTSSSGDRESLLLDGIFNIAIGGQLLITEGYVYIQDVNDINSKVPGSLVIEGGTIECPHVVEVIVDVAIPEEDRENVDVDVVHDFVLQWEKVLKKPTCHEEGLKQLHYECTSCVATEDMEEVIPKLEHEKVWSNDKNYHWSTCVLCGDVLDPKETHTFVVVGGITYCVVCGYVQEESGGVQSGFDVTVEDLIPAGYLTASEKDPVTSMYTINLTTTNPESEPDHFMWFIDDNQVEGAEGTSIQAEYRYESFNVMCVFWNEKGTGSASLTIQ